MATMTLRYFRCFYECVECTRVGSEWTCERVTLGPDWCPNCGLEADPYASEALFDECEADEEPELTDIAATHSWPEAA